MPGSNEKRKLASGESYPDGNDLEAIVQRAVDGDSAAAQKLIEITTPRIRRYVFRSTLDENLTDDLVQDIYCKMIESIAKLRDVSAFWAWLYRIASNCVNSYYRGKSKQAAKFNLKDEMLELMASEDHPADLAMIRSELVQAVMESVSTLTPRHRQVITLRCFENMSFKQISKVEHTNEMYTRVVFARAVEKLRVALRKRGFRNASLVFVLAVFGKATACCRAEAVAIKAGAIKTYAAAKGFGLGSKVVELAAKASVHYLKTTIAVVVAAGVALTPVVVGPLRGNVESIHYTVHGVRPVENEETESVVKKSSSSSSSSSSFGMDRSNRKYESMGMYENMMYFPDGYDGAVLRFMQRWSMGGNKLCSWLQDGNANYYYASGDAKVFITNDPLRMVVLPTDEPEFVEFMRSHYGYDSRVSSERRRFSGLLRQTTDNRVPKYSGMTWNYEYNDIELSDLIDSWPTDIVDIEDKRDQMHKRGWAFFEITGQIQGLDVSGYGRIPFVYNKYEENRPWLYVVVADSWYLDMCEDVSFVVSGYQRQQYKGGVLFDGLLRPWEGFACIDSVMRDAAKYRIPFATEENGSSATVSLYVNTTVGRVEIIYDIDRDVDIIRSIKFLKGDDEIGHLDFRYEQQIDNPDSDKYNPPIIDPSSSKRNKPNELWLSTLINNVRS